MLGEMTIECSKTGLILDASVRVNNIDPVTNTTKLAARFRIAEADFK